MPTRDVGARLLAVTGDGLPAGSARVASGADPYLDAGKTAKPRKGASTLFVLEVRNDAAGPLKRDFYVGTDGDHTVWLNGTAIATRTRPFLALWDDHVVPMTIPPGRNLLAVETRAKSSGKLWRIAARFGGPSGGGLRFYLRQPASGAPSADALAADACTPTLTFEPTAAGFEVTVSVSRRGSGPPGVAVPWSLAWAGAEGRPAATGSAGDAPKKVQLTFPKDGTFNLVLRYGPLKLERRLRYTKRFHTAWSSSGRNIALAKRHTSFPIGSRESLQYLWEEYGRNLVEDIPDQRWLGERLVILERWSQDAARGRDPYDDARGDFYRAYESPYDGAMQPYSVHVPSRYDGKASWPLVIGLHGIGSGTHYTLRRVLGKDRDKEGGEVDGKPMIRGNMPTLPDYGVLTATAWGYHNSAFWFYGEDDVLRVVDEMKKKYRIDEDRVYLTGLSLGGLGTYHVGHHFPDRFAALGPLGGFSSVKMYQQIRKYPKTSWETVLVEQRDATSYAENGLHNPMKVVHGRFDAPNHAKAMTKRYDALGYRYELDIPELPHDVWQYSYGDGALVKWLKRWTRPSNPDEIVFKTLSYRYTEAYWARIGWIDDYTRAALLRLEVGPDRRRITLSTLDNLRGVALDLTRPALKFPVTLALPGGKELMVPVAGIVHLHRDKSEWTIATSSTPPAGWKRTGVSGPLDDVMHEPHVFVVGTADPEQTDTNRRLIEEDRRYIRHLEHEIAFPVRDDSDVTGDALKGNLVLYGNPSSNRVLAAAIATGKLPLSFEKDALVVGKTRYPGRDVGVKTILPNPWNPAKVIVIVAGVTRRGTLLSRYLPRFLPDLIVYDERVSSRYVERILIDRPVLFGGFYDSDWRLPAALR